MCVKALLQIRFMSHIYSGHSLHNVEKIQQLQVELQATREEVKELKKQSASGTVPFGIYFIDSSMCYVTDNIAESEYQTPILPMTTNTVAIPEVKCIQHFTCEYFEYNLYVSSMVPRENIPIKFSENYVDTGCPMH